MAGTWRARARVVLREVFAELPEGATVKEARKAVRDAYPFGLRECYPYKVWLDESRRWMAQRFPELRKEPVKIDVECGGPTDQLPLSFEEEN